MKWLPNKIPPLSVGYMHFSLDLIEIERNTSPCSSNKQNTGTSLLDSKTVLFSHENGLLTSEQPCLLLDHTQFCLLAVSYDNVLSTTRLHHRLQLQSHNSYSSS